MAEYHEQLWAEGGGGFLLLSSGLNHSVCFLSLIHPQCFSYVNNHIYFNNAPWWGRKVDLFTFTNTLNLFIYHTFLQCYDFSLCFVFTIYLK